MEKYLIEQYKVIEDDKYLTNVSDIEDFFTEVAREYMECGQGYYQDEAEFICKIGDKFYKVIVLAEIGSAKQDRGDRLYWIEGIDSIKYREVEKPKPITKDNVRYEVSATSQQIDSLEEYMLENRITFEKGTIK